jgi:voltage-gated potassium channel
MFKSNIHKFITQNQIFLKFIYVIIILNVLSVVLSSYKEIHHQYETHFNFFELVSIVIFSLEYIIRFWTSDIEYKTGTSLTKKIKFFFSTFGLIDLLAILPFYLPLFFAFDLRVLRILRLFRLLRILKLGRLSKSLKLISNVLKDSKSELSITLFVTFILLTLSSTLMYYVENGAQPDKFENIGQSFWWAVSTLTTVGYGDVYPITGLGKILSSIVAIIGIGIVALPTAIISSAFINNLQKNKESKNECKCPNCGEKFTKKE